MTAHENDASRGLDVGGLTSLTYPPSAGVRPRLSPEAGFQRQFMPLFAGIYGTREGSASAGEPRPGGAAAGGGPQTSIRALVVTVRSFGSLK